MFSAMLGGLLVQQWGSGASSESTALQSLHGMFTLSFNSKSSLMISLEWFWGIFSIAGIS